MNQLTRMPQFIVLGGCCGTDHRHVEQICLACTASERFTPDTGRSLRGSDAMTAKNVCASYIDTRRELDQGISGHVVHWPKYRTSSSVSGLPLCAARKAK